MTNKNNLPLLSLQFGQALHAHPKTSKDGIKENSYKLQQNGGQFPSFRAWLLER